MIGLWTFDSRPPIAPNDAFHPPMCYFLYLASPLTLSEVRSMLPTGLTADLASYPDQQRLKSIHPAAQTVALVLAGRCSCDLVRERLPDPREDERHLRERYRGRGLSRTAVIDSLERHRQRARAGTAPDGGWQKEFAAFVIEHARNAGPTLYLMEFAAGDSRKRLATMAPLATCPVGEVRLHPALWLMEGKPTAVG